jgi:uncharacterized HhH-GPD family protein
MSSEILVWTPMPKLCLAQDHEADELLSTDPLALLIGMVLDQQVPLERAFRSPYDLKERLGRPLDAPELADMDPDELAAIFSTPPALHRFPKSMAARVQEMCRSLRDDYGGDAAQVWKQVPSGEELFERIRALPGFGEQKARIFVAFLAKRLGVQPPGWEQVAEPYGEAGSHRSVADIEGPGSLARVREFKRSMKAASKASARP